MFSSVEALYLSVFHNLWLLSGPDPVLANFVVSTHQIFALALMKVLKGVIQAHSVYSSCDGYLNTPLPLYASLWGLSDSFVLVVESRE